MHKFILTTIIAFLAINGLYAQKKDTAQVEPQIKLELVWEEEFASPILDFILQERKKTPTLRLVITADAVRFLKTGKEILLKSVRVNENESLVYSALCSRNGKYIGIRKDHYGEYGRLLEGSEYLIYDDNGNLLTRRNINNNYIPGILLNNGAFLITGVLEDGRIFLEQLNGTKKLIFDHDDMQPSTYIDIAKKSNFFALNISGIGVILYDDTGGEVWRKKIENSHAAGIGISPYGSYIACFGNKWGNILYFYSSKGDILWEKPIGAGTHFVSFSPDEKFLAVYATWSGIWFFDIEGNLLWYYSAEKIGKKVDNNFTRSIYSLAVCANGVFVVCSDGGGTRELPAGDSSNVYLFDKKGNIAWQKALRIQKERAPNVRFTDDGKYLLICNSNRLYCYKIVGGGQ